MEFYGFVYKITNQQNNKVYIGIQTTNRMDYLGGGVLIIKARQKYGKRFFVKEILGYCKNKKELCDAEKMCIDFLIQQIDCMVIIYLSVEKVDQKA